MPLNESQAETRLSDLVAEEIRALLARRRISGRELARQMGKSPSWVNFRLTGHTPIDLNDLDEFAKFFGVPLQSLLPGRTAGSSPWYDRLAQTAIARKPDPSTSRPRDTRPTNRPSGPSRPVILPAVRRPQPRFATLPGTERQPGGGRLPA